MYKLICPVCSRTLVKTEDSKSLSCESNHLFDIARQGYVNLLLSHQKKSRQPGDDIKMVSSRTQFLDRGFYANIISAFINAIEPFTDRKPSDSFFHYCDIACGEGYYTDSIHKEIQGNQHFVSTGIDISSAAIKSASRRNKSIQWLIASANSLPIENVSQNLVSCLFYRPNTSEIARILRNNGVFVTVSTGRNHLIELREIVYDKIKSEKEPDSNLVPQQLEHLDFKSLSSKFTLESSEEIMQLLAMTPHYWRATQAKKHELSLLGRLTLTLDIKLNIYQKNAG